MLQRVVLLSPLILGVIAQREPAEFTANPSIGGGSHSKIRLISASTTRELEAVYSCFVGSLGWRSSGLSYRSNNDNGPWYKTNVYGVNSLGGAGG
jgi:hypothetical protein